MKKVATLLAYGESHFGSGSYNTEEFHTFFDLFKRSFNKELKSVGATKIEYSKGHFYLSGFFTIDAQAYYFSISDVRGMFDPKPQLLVRTATSYTDYTGGANNYFKVEPGMTKIMANNWGFDYNKSKSATSKTSDAIATAIFNSDKRYHEMSIPSTKKAQNIAFKLIDLFGGQISPKNKLITDNFWKKVFKGGRRENISSSNDNEVFEFYYDAKSKRMSITFKGLR